MTVRLFVYGTLRSDGHAFATMLADSVCHTEPAELADHAMYDIGLPYPFVIPERGERVVGEVVSIAPSAWTELAPRLDEYEGFEYERGLATVSTSTGPVTAQVYLARSAVRLDPASRVPTGDWTDAV